MGKRGRNGRGGQSSGRTRVPGPTPQPPRPGQIPVRKKPRQPVSQPQRPPIAAGPPRDLRVTIGIDFGTRYTKMAYTVLGSGIRRLVRSSSGNPLFQSRLFVDGRQRVWLGPAPADSPNPRREIPYLKMLACSPALGGVLGLEDLVREDSTDLDALAAYYLSWMIMWSRRVVMTAEEVQTRGDKVEWLTCLSVPAEFCGGPMQEKFRRIADVAHRWAYAGLGEGIAWPELTQRFRQLAASGIEFRVAVIPEIVAGLHHVITDPSTPEGIHGFLDVGGGTVDGAFFRILELDGRRQVNILSTGVIRLGSAIVAHRALLDAHARAERLLMGASADTPDLRLNYDGSRTELQAFANGLMADAARANLYGILHDDPLGAKERSLAKDARKAFRIDAAGGGAQSEWYLSTIAGCERNVRHATYGGMPFEIGCLPAPAGYDEPGSPFERFAVAWNLATDPDALETLRTLLPRELSAPAQMPEKAWEPIDWRAIT